MTKAIIAIVAIVAIIATTTIVGLAIGSDDVIWNIASALVVVITTFLWRGYRDRRDKTR